MANTITTDLIPAKTISNFVEMRGRMKRHIRAIRRHHRALNKICDDFLQDYAIRNFLYTKLLSESTKFRERVDGAFWKALMQTALVSNAMTERKRREFTARLEGRTDDGSFRRQEEGDPPIPIFNRFEIDKLASTITEQYASIIETTVRDVFAEFTNVKYGGRMKGSSRSKVNNLRGIERRFIARGEIYCQDSGRFDVRENRYGVGFEDLLTACYICDVGIRPNYAEKFFALAMKAFDAGEHTVVTPYFSVRCHKNGNHHVAWNDGKIDVLHAINRIGSGGEKIVPGPDAKKYKSEHFRQEDVHGG